MRIFVAFLVVISILLTVAVAGNVLVDDLVRPETRYRYLVATTLLTGLLTTAVIEWVRRRPAPARAD